MVWVFLVFFEEKWLKIMIKKIGGKLELIYYLFFFLNLILYKKKFKEKFWDFFYLDLILLYFIKKSLFNSGLYRIDFCLILVFGDYFKI